MEPRITVLTLGVSDLERSLKFYRDGLGMYTQGITGTEFEHGAVAFFDLQNGLKLAIWHRADIAHDTGLPTGLPSGLCRSRWRWPAGHGGWPATRCGQWRCWSSPRRARC